MRIIKDKLIAFFSAHLVHYATPVNLTYTWSLGAMAGICLVIQIISGLFLAMHYIPDADTAFLSVNDGIMQNVKYGWLFRYVHANGASLFFIVVYGHIFKALYYSSYCKPRHLMYFAGIIIFVLMMATAFIGYVLPWGQMSLWGATVITNLFSAIPFVGDDLVRWLWGGYGVGAPTLVRFASLHFFLPYIIAAFVGVHLVLLHTEGSSNPLGINNVSLTSFYPSFGIKDLLSALVLLFVLAYLVTFEPNLLGHADNYIPANPLVTPAHIVPEWYFLPFYAILRSIPDKLGGVLAMFSAILILFILPFVNTSEIRSAYFRPFYSFFLLLLVGDVFLLGWIGSLPVEEPFVTWGAYLTAYYFSFFILFVPLSGVLDASFSAEDSVVDEVVSDPQVVSKPEEDPESSYLVESGLGTTLDKLFFFTIVMILYISFRLVLIYHFGVLHPSDLF